MVYLYFCYRCMAEHTELSCSKATCPNCCKSVRCYCNLQKQYDARVSKDGRKDVPLPVYCCRCGMYGHQLNTCTNICIRCKFQTTCENCTYLTLADCHAKNGHSYFETFENRIERMTVNADRKKCMICLKAGHERINCSSNKVCTKCSRVGKLCTCRDVDLITYRKQIEPNFKLYVSKKYNCMRCGSPAHWRNECTELCSLCGQAGSCQCTQADYKFMNRQKIDNNDTVRSKLVQHAPNVVIKDRINYLERLQKATQNWKYFKVVSIRVKSASLEKPLNTNMIDETIPKVVFDDPFGHMRNIFRGNQTTFMSISYSGQTSAVMAYLNESSSTEFEVCVYMRGRDLLLPYIGCISEYVDHTKTDKGALPIRHDNPQYSQAEWVEVQAVDLLEEDIFRLKCTDIITNASEEGLVEFRARYNQVTEWRPSNLLKRQLSLEDWTEKEMDFVLEPTRPSLKLDSVIQSYINLLAFNEMQRHALELSLKTGLTAVQGPPGTGKTSTLACVAAFHTAVFGHSVIILSPKNVAVDEAFLKVLEIIENPNFVRWVNDYGLPQIDVGNLTRQFAAVNRLLPATCSDKRIYSHSNLALKRAHRNNRGGHILFTTTGVMQSGNRQIQRTTNPDLVIIDESSCLGVAEIWDLFGSSPAEYFAETRTKRLKLRNGKNYIVKRMQLYGDHQQLPIYVDPVVNNTFTGNGPVACNQCAVAQQKWKTSAMELFHCSHPTSCKTTLNICYRGREQLFKTSAYLYPNVHLIYKPYHSAYRAAFEQGRHNSVLREGSSLIWFNVEGEQKETRESQQEALDTKTIENYKEVRFIERLLTQLCVLGLSPCRITVETFYTGQLKLLRKILEKRQGKQWVQSQLRTADSYQGGQNDVVIVSICRTVKSLGFLKNTRLPLGGNVANPRCNVAFTRAKKLMIIVGKYDITDQEGGSEYLIRLGRDMRQMVVEENDLKNMVLHECTHIGGELCHC